MTQIPRPVTAAAAAGPLPTASCDCGDHHRAACRIETARWARRFGLALRTPAGDGKV